MVLLSNHFRVLDECADGDHTLRDRPYAVSTNPGSNPIGFYTCLRCKGHVSVNISPEEAEIFFETPPKD
jgi:hypothetical protein